jgi:NADH-quinone oxidoreductase subunit L
LETPLHEFTSPATARLQHKGLSWLPFLSVALAVAGVGVAWFEFGRPAAAPIGFVERVPVVGELFANRWYLDHVYRAFVEVVIDGFFSRICTRNEDKVINDGIDGFSKAALDSGRFASLLQSGKLRYNMMVMVGAMALVALYFLVV